MDPRVSRFAVRGWSVPALAGFLAVAAARLLTLPKSLWEWDEILFLQGVIAFDPLHHHPHPPGFPLYIGLGKVFAFLVRDPYWGLVTLGVVASLVGYAALVSAFRRLGSGDERVAVGGALLFQLSPAMLVYAPLALSDCPAALFLSLFLAAAARLPGNASPAAALATGAFAAGAIGCRPQLTAAVLAALAAALWLAGSWRRRGAMLAAFTVVCLLWFVPLLAAVGGPDGLLRFLSKQAGAVAKWDTTVPRAGQPATAIAARFLAHPWGQKWTAVPVLALALAGAASLARTRPRWKPLLPLLVLTAVELAVCLTVLNPRDAVRYAIPTLIGVSFAAAVGLDLVMRRARVPAAAWVAVAALAAGFAVYTWPLLGPRSTTPSPPVQAADWVRTHLPRNTVLLVEKDYAAHAAFLLHGFTRFPYEEGMRRFAGRPEKPLFIFGETVLPGAQTFLWPPSDTYGKLTRDLYRTTSLSPVPAEQRYEAVRGLYAYEPLPGGAGFRWLGEDAVIRVFPRPLRARAVALILGLPEEVGEESVALAISVAGSPTATVEVPRGVERRIVLPLPDAETVEISIRSAKTFVPVTAGIGGDPRRLAVQLDALELLGG
ncbi:MAG TPA: glycosyltransferase family 39 protein [Thermoanaerobaculia bacterium]|nr:glycosyltransferase family 39 protein [Thermoanaerobaculia bacterium]